MSGVKKGSGFQGVAQESTVLHRIKSESQLLFHVLDILANN